MRRIFVFAFSLLLCSTLTFAQSNEKLAEETLRKTGSLDQIDQMDKLLESQILSKKGEFEDAKSYDVFSKIMKQCFGAEKFKTHFVEYFAKNANEDSLKAISALYDMPLMKEFAELEKAGQSADAQVKMTAYFQQFQTNPPSAARIQQVAILHTELNTAKLTVNMFKNLMSSMLVGLNHILDEEEKVSDEDIKKTLETALPPTFEQQLLQQYAAVSLFTYKDVSDEKLAEYINVWKGSTGKYFIEHSMAAFDFAFSKVGEEMGEAFAAELGDKK